MNSKSGRGACLGGIDIFLHGAPALVSAHADTSGMGASQDCTIALAYLDQDANAMGLGCCWLGFFTRRQQFPANQGRGQAPQGAPDIWEHGDRLSEIQVPEGADAQSFRYYVVLTADPVLPCQ